MQLTIELDDNIAQAFFDCVPETKRKSYLNALLASHFLAKTPNDDQLPFDVLPKRGVRVDNELVNRLREEAGI